MQNAEYNQPFCIQPMVCLSPVIDSHFYHGNKLFFAYLLSNEVESMMSCDEQDTKRSEYDVYCTYPDQGRLEALNTSRVAIHKNMTTFYAAL